MYLSLSFSVWVCVCVGLCFIEKQLYLTLTHSATERFFPLKMKFERNEAPSIFSLSYNIYIESVDICCVLFFPSPTFRWFCFVYFFSIKLTPFLYCFFFFIDRHMNGWMDRIDVWPIIQCHIWCMGISLMHICAILININSPKNLEKHKLHVYSTDIHGFDCVEWNGMERCGVYSLSHSKCILRRFWFLQVRNLCDISNFL